MNLLTIDKMPKSKEKLQELVKFAVLNDIKGNMPEIEELYQSLKKDKLITQKQYNKMFDIAVTNMNGDGKMSGQKQQNQNKKELTLREQLLAAGMKESEVDTHSSDLYVLKNDISTAFIENYEFKNNVTTFKSQIDGLIWYDIPFGYMNEHYELRKQGRD
ncbi:hypothetical protein CN918_29495 [Priestia megaterium]|nr:hypothetical protein CN918_29495 [Priestia megaterium]